MLGKKILLTPSRRSGGQKQVLTDKIEFTNYNEIDLLIEIFDRIIEFRIDKNKCKS